MTRDDVIRMAREAGFDRSNPHCDLMVIHSNGSWVGIEKELTRFAGLVIADFLARTGQYVTNDASRESAITEAASPWKSAVIDQLVMAHILTAEHAPWGIVLVNLSRFPTIEVCGLRYRTLKYRDK